MSEDEIVRFGVAMEKSLLDAFDALIARKGYGNRSEALRDRVRAMLLEETIASGANVSGTLTIVYRHHVPELKGRLIEAQHALGSQVVAAMHVHLDHDNCLEVIVFRGVASEITAAADRMLALRGVVNGRLTLTGVPRTTAAVTKSAATKTAAKKRKTRARKHAH